MSSGTGPTCCMIRLICAFCSAWMAVILYLVSFASNACVSAGTLACNALSSYFTKSTSDFLCLQTCLPSRCLDPLFQTLNLLETLNPFENEQPLRSCYPWNANTTVIIEGIIRDCAKSHDSGCARVSLFVNFDRCVCVFINALVGLLTSVCSMVLRIKQLEELQENSVYQNFCMRGCIKVRCHVIPNRISALNLSYFFLLRPCSCACCRPLAARACGICSCSMALRHWCVWSC